MEKTLGNKEERNFIDIIFIFFGETKDKRKQDVRQNVRVVQYSFGATAANH